MWGEFLLDVFCNFKRDFGYEEVPDFEDVMAKIQYISNDFVRLYDDETEEYDVTSFVLSEVVNWFYRSFENHPGMLDNILLEMFVGHYKVHIPVENPFNVGNLVSDKHVDDSLCKEGYTAIAEKIKNSEFGVFLEVSDDDTLYDLNVKVMPFVHYFLTCEFLLGKLDDECPEHIMSENDEGDILIQAMKAMEIEDIKVDFLDEAEALINEDKKATNLSKVQSEVADLMLRIEEQALSGIMNNFNISYNDYEKSPKKARTVWG